MKASPRCLVLDSQGLSLLLAGDEYVTALIDRSRSRDALVVVSPLTVLEARGRTAVTRMNWLLSRLTVEPATKADAVEAMKLLDAARWDSRPHAVDALVAAMALRLPQPVAMVTSDPDDWAKLAGGRVGIIRV